MTIDPIITITRADIVAAKQARRDFEDRKVTSFCRSSSCPIAQALHRIYPGVQFAVAERCLGYKKGDIDMFTFVLSREAQDFLHRADKMKDRVRQTTLRLF